MVDGTGRSVPHVRARYRQSDHKSIINTLRSERGTVVSNSTGPSRKHGSAMREVVALLAPQCRNRIGRWRRLAAFTHSFLKQNADGRRNQRLFEDLVRLYPRSALRLGLE